MKVKLIRHTPSPEELVTASAKLCYSPVGVDEIEKDLTESNIQKFLGKLINMGHESPLEHISFTFAVDGVSRVLSHQLVRHRIASYSQQSQRYVRENQFEYITPIIIKMHMLDEYEEHMHRTQELYDILTLKMIFIYIVEEHTNWINQFECQYLGNSDDIIDFNNEEGVVDAVTAFKNENKREYIKFEKRAIEDARYVLPNATETKIVLTMNARSLLNFFSLRCCNKAQWEIRELADRMLIECKKVAPIIFSKAGPECIRTKCPEGNNSCGNPRYELLKL